MSNGLRYAIALVLAVIVTLAAFYLMHRLISGSHGDPEDMDPPPGIRFGPVEIDPEVQTRDRRRPDPPEPPDEPPPPPDMEISNMDRPQQQIPNLDMPNIDVPFSGSGPFLGNWNQDRTEEGDVVPLVRIQPQYPREAAIAQIEGWVKVEFTITETGSVTDPQVVDAKPNRVFNREAIRAILRWRFKPRIVDGVPVARRATQVIEFTLDDI